MIETINKVIKASRLLVQELGERAVARRGGRKSGVFGREGSDSDEDCPGANFPWKHRLTVMKMPIFDLIEDKSVITPHESALFDDLIEQVNKTLATLTPREEKGFENAIRDSEKYDHTLEEVGQVFE